MVVTYLLIIQNFAEKQNNRIMSKSILNLCALALLTMMCSCEEQTVTQRNVLLVRAEPVVMDEKMEIHDYPGLVKPQEELAVSFKVSGQIKTLVDKEGTEVRKGSLLASLDSRDYKVSLEAARAAYEQSAKEFGRIRQLYDSKTISPNDYEKAEAAHQVVQAKYQAASDACEYTHVVAPFDGYVQSVYHREGEVVQAGMPVLTLISKNACKVEIFLPYRDYERIDCLRDARLIVDGKSCGIELSGLSHQANAAQLYKAEFEVKSGEEARSMVAGKNCSVELSFSTENKAQTAIIPVSAIKESKGAASVWVLDSHNKVSKSGVKIQHISHDKACVVGLREGQRVVTSGVNAVKEGDAVEVMPVSSKTNVGGML